MKQLTAALAGLFTSGLILFFVGCSSSELVNTWSTHSFQAPPLTHMLVISFGGSPAQRRLWEDVFSEALARHAVAATASYTMFASVVPDTAQVDSLVLSQGFDGVLVTRWLPPETTPQYLQGYVTTEQELRYDRHTDRFVRYYRDLEHAGYVDSQKVNMRAIDVWSTGSDGQLVWSGTSKTPDGSPIQTRRPEISQLVMDELAKYGFIASAQ
jgi:hypothetical protein